MARLLLISNSGRPYLEHCREPLLQFLSGSRQAVFVAMAAFLDPREYLAKVQGALANAPFRIDLLEPGTDAEDRLKRADAILVGGGNTYRLLKMLRESELLQAIHERVSKGVPFVGWSAGANIAGPNILTTNDWNVVGLSRFEGLGLVPFNINPHYKEMDPAMAQFSETRDDRIREYHEVWEIPVAGIEEQTMIVAENGKHLVSGQGRVRIFRKGLPPRDFRNGETLSLG